MLYLCYLSCICVEQEFFNTDRSKKHRCNTDEESYLCQWEPSNHADLGDSTQMTQIDMSSASK